MSSIEFVETTSVLTKIPIKQLVATAERNQEQEQIQSANPMAICFTLHNDPFINELKNNHRLLTYVKLKSKTKNLWQCQHLQYNAKKLGIYMAPFLGERAEEHPTTTTLMGNKYAFTRLRKSVMELLVVSLQKLESSAHSRGSYGLLNDQKKDSDNNVSS